MYVYETSRSSDQPRQITLLFGYGLIGSAVGRSLACHDQQTIQSRRLQWSDPDLLEQDLESVATELQRRERHEGLPELERLSIVWTAGGCGFQSTTEETERELISFERVLNALPRLVENLAADHAVFHLVSSAGALFEGQRHVTNISQPAPHRPYGHLKWAQEQRLARLPAGWRTAVHRVATAYGLITPHHRAGLITTLVRNALHHRTTQIYGRPTTLRDFVCVDDIGAYLTAWLTSSSVADLPSEAVLATARPAAIYEIQHLVSAAVQQPVPLQYIPSRGNDQDITFLPAALPTKRWAPTNLQANILRIATRYRESMRYASTT